MKDYANLLPGSYRRACLARRRLRQWSVVWSAVGLGLAIGWFDERTQWQAALEDVERHERRYDEVRLLKTKISRLVVQAQTLNTRQDFLVRLQKTPPPLLPVGLISTSASRCEGRVAVQQMVYSEEACSPLAATPSPSPPVEPSAVQPPSVQPPAGGMEPEVHCQARLTIAGVGADNLAIAEFVLGLRESGAFDRVDLKSAAASASANFTTYQVECGL